MADPMIKLVTNGTVYEIKKSILVERSDYFNAFLQRFDVPDLEEEIEINNVEYDEEVLKLLANPEYKTTPYAKDAVTFYGLKDVKYRDRFPNTNFNSLQSSRSYHTAIGIIFDCKLKSEKIDKHHQIYQVHSETLYTGSTSHVRTYKNMLAKGFYLVGNIKDIEKVIDCLNINISYRDEDRNGYGSDKSYIHIPNGWIKQKMKLFDIKISGYFPLAFVLREICNMECDIEFQAYPRDRWLEDVTIVYSTVGPYHISKSYIDADNIIEYIQGLPANEEKSTVSLSFTKNLAKMICISIFDMDGEPLFDLSKADLYVHNAGWLTYCDEMLQYDKLQNGIPCSDLPVYTITFGDLNKNLKWSKSWLKPEDVVACLVPSAIKRTICIYVLLE